MKATRRAILAAAALLPAPALRAQDYPARPVRIVVPYAPGGPSDILARVLGAALHQAWGQPVVIENRPGAGSAIGTEAVARAAPDGYTLLMAASAHVMIPPMMPRLAYDAVRDFTPIINCAFHPIVLVVHPNTPARNMAEFVALARSRPGGVTLGSSGVGTASHLSVALLAQVAGVELTHVPFNGSAPAQAAVLSGQVQGGFLNSTVAAQQTKAGAMRGLGVTATTRWRELPDLPTLPEQGFAVEAGSWYGILAPAGLPAPIARKLHDDIQAALRQPAVRERVIAAGLDPLEVGSEAFRAQIRAELEKWSQVIREAGIKAD